MLRITATCAFLALAAPPAAAGGAFSQLSAYSPASVTTPSQAPAPSPAAASAPLICVDPGHPNTYNSGLAAVNGTNETAVNWQVAGRLARILGEKGFRVVLTRDAELTYMENKDRARFCNASGAALAVHLHCDAVPGASGFALYYPDRGGVYDFNNDPENGFRGPAAGVLSASRDLAAAVQAGIAAELGGALAARGVFGESRSAVGSRQGALTYSIFSQIPTVTVEMVVLTTRKDAEFIKTEAGQEKMAAAIAAGLARYAAN
jgi:N-acetylmuramoyl-L-alanine amidase